jgi:hypothetical protein
MKRKRKKKWKGRSGRGISYRVKAWQAKGYFADLRAQGSGLNARAQGSGFRAQAWSCLGQRYNTYSKHRMYGLRFVYRAPE